MSKHHSEDDVADDPQLAQSRDTGGAPGADEENPGSTTSTSPTEEFVGRIAGDDVGYAGQTGAEARTEGGDSDG